MTTLTGKFQETTKRLQQLTVWKPNERDPFIELDRWRTNAHQTIEQIYNRKREQIEQLIDKHEREFMRQIARQRALLTSIRKRLMINKDQNQSFQLQNQASIQTDLQKIENDINTKLGRAEIIIAIQPLNIDETVSVSLQTYLSLIPSMYAVEYSTKNQPVKPKRRSANEVKHAYEIWRENKEKEVMSISQNRLQSARQRQQNTEECLLRRRKDSVSAYENWLEQKKKQGVFTKKRTSFNDDETKDESNETID